jgi:hypothetical protein
MQGLLTGGQDGYASEDLSFGVQPYTLDYNYLSISE